MKKLYTVFQVLLFILAIMSIFFSPQGKNYNILYDILILLFFASIGVRKLIWKEEKVLNRTGKTVIWIVFVVFFVCSFLMFHLIIG